MKPVTKPFFQAKGWVTNANYNAKKFTLLLFINNRLVDSSALRRAIDMVYSAYLPKGTHPFVYMSLSIAPRSGHEHNHFLLTFHNQG